MKEEKELYSKEAVLNLSSMAIKYLLKAVLELTEDPGDFPSYELANSVEEYMNNIPDEEDFIIDDLIEYLRNDSDFMNDVDKLVKHIEKYNEEKEKRTQEREDIFEDEED